MAKEFGLHGNVIGLFYHDLMIHFSGIVIHRESVGHYGDDLEFPFVNKKYALSPFILAESNFACELVNRDLKIAWREFPLTPIAAGEAIPIRTGMLSIQSKIVSTFTTYIPFVKASLPDRSEQWDALQCVIIELCRRLVIPRADVVIKNWKRYFNLHTTSDDRVVPHRGLIVGTRASIQNRKLAINYLQQSKPVVGMTHGEISNSVFDEPLFGYAELGLCSVLLDYGERCIKGKLNQPLIPPDVVLSRTSQTIKRVYRKSAVIGSRKLEASQRLYVPTVYNQNLHYAPYRGFEDGLYLKWQTFLLDSFKDLTLKVHPKSYKPPFDVPMETRLLEQCIREYDVLVLDYYSTAASIALFTQKPVIFFDIGLRNLVPEYLELVRKRCHYVLIDWSQDISEQIVEAVTLFQNTTAQWSNIDLEPYAIRSDNADGLWGGLTHVLRPNF